MGYNNHSKGKKIHKKGHQQKRKKSRRYHIGSLQVVKQNNKAESIYSQLFKNINLLLDFKIIDMYKIDVSTNCGKIATIAHIATKNKYDERI